MAQPTILCVEDHFHVSDIMQKLLIRMGYRVVVASNGVEALKVMEDKGETIDLVLTDVEMPLMDGPELVRQVMLRWPEVKIVFVSAYPQASLVDGGRLPEDAVFLEKPLDWRLVAETLRGLVSLDPRP